MKKLFFFSILALLSLTMHAQHFDWATSYSGYPGQSDAEIPGNNIVGTAVDSEGNVYILGQFYPGAQLQGIDPVPRDIVIGYPKSLLIAKFNPDGELVWHKAICPISESPSNEGVYGDCMRLVGDSALMVLGHTNMPYTGDMQLGLYLHLYYLDSLYTESGDLMNEDSVSDGSVTFFITLDLDGNRKEKHFLQMSAIDTSGVGYYSSSNKIMVCNMLAEFFDVDNEGNIYLGRRPGEQYWERVDGDFVYHSFPNGDIGTQRIVVDGTRSLYWSPDLEPRGQFQIIKFTPHFDNIINATFIFDSTDVYGESDLFFSGNGTPMTVSAKVYAMNLDEQNNLYICLSCDNPNSHMPLANSDTLALVCSNEEYIQAAMIKYDNTLTPKYIAQLRRTPETNSDALALNPWSNFYITASAVDEGTNSVYVAGRLQKRGFYNYPANIESQVIYKGDTLDLVNNMFWLRLDRDNGHLISYGKADSEIGTELYGYYRSKTGICVQNGVVAATVKYWENIHFADTSYTVSGEDAKSTALCIWDENGNELKCPPFRADGTRSTTGEILATNNAIYITGISYSSVQCGDIELPATGHSQAYIVKYSDTIFGTVPGTTERQPQHITWEQDLVFTSQSSPIVLSATATSGLPVHYASSNPDVAYIDDGMLFQASEGNATVTATQPGNYIYLAAEPVTKTIRTSQGGEGIDNLEIQNSRFEINIYPNPTDSRTTITCDLPITELTLCDLMGRSLSTLHNCGTSATLDLSAFAKGLYLIKVKTSKGTTMRKISVR